MFLLMTGTMVTFLNLGKGCATLLSVKAQVKLLWVPNIFQTQHLEALKLF